jgi:hypothetical protein
VTPGNIEVVHHVAVRILVSEHFRARLRGELEPETSLPNVAPRLHAHFHHAFADRRRVGELVGVPDDVLNFAVHHERTVSVR